MLVKKLLHKTHFKSVKFIHATRLSALLACVESLLNRPFLTVTALDRGLTCPARVK